MTTSPNFSFKARLFLCFLSVLLLFILWAAGYFFIDYKQRQLSNFSLKLNNIQIEYFKGVNDLDKFMIAGFHDPAFYKNGHQQNIDDFLEFQKGISVKLEGLKDEAERNHLKLSYQLNSLTRLSKCIAESGTQLRYVYFKKGFVDYGTEGEMRKHAHWIEVRGKIAKVDILMLRRHEKDYIMRGKQLYANEYYGTIDSLIKLCRSKDSTYLELANYQNSFRELVKYSVLLGTFDKVGIVPATQNYISAFNKVFAATYTFSIKEVARLQNIFTVLLIVITIIFIVSAFFLCYYLSQFLTADIRELNQRMDAFMNADFKNIKITEPENNIRPRSIEVQRLFNDFDELKTTLLNYINNLNLQTDDLQCLNEELQAQSEELKSLNEELEEQRELEYEANERYNFVTKATSDAIWDWDLAKDTLMWGEGFKTIFGHHIKQIQSARDKMKSFLHPEDAERVIKGIHEIIAGKDSIWKAEYRYLKADGSYAYVVDRGFVIRNENDHAIRIVGAMHDITQRRREDHHLKLLRSVITNANDAVIITEPKSVDDPSPQIIYVNEAFTRITGYTEDEVSGKSPRILEGPNSDKDELARLTEAVYNWKPCEITIINYKKNGEEYWVNISISPVADEKGHYTHMIAILRDITSKKKAELELKLFADDLFSRNKELHQFGYVVSHNLRSPIANIMGITNLLELDKDDPETLERCTTNLKTAVHSLDSVVKDLSKILTITDGSVELTKEKVDLTLILNNIKNDLEEVFDHSKAKVEIPVDSFFLFSHKAYLYSIFYNLISNAIKYKSKHNPEIRINVSTTTEFLLVSVTDNGIGIDLDKYSDDLFKPYKRFNLAVEGKGLGLFLVKSHIESLNGTITIDSKLGAGTTFTIKLPFNSNQNYINN